MIRRNVASQGVYILAFDTNANTPKTGDAANITGYVSKDGGAATALGSGVTEISSTNMPGVYWQPLTAGETDGDSLCYGWKSSTANISIEPLLGLSEPAPGTTGGAAGFAQLPAALVGGRVDASVGAMAADVLTSSALAASATAEIQSGLATQASVDAIDDFVDTEVAAIKAKTDQLTFTSAGKVDATIQVAADFTQAAADKVWSSATRTLTSFGSLVAGIWDALTSGMVTAGSIGKLILDNLDAKVSTRAAAGANITVASVVSSDGTVTVYEGTDYLGAEGLTFTNSAENFADVSAVTLKVKNGDGTVLSFAGTMVSSTQLRVELTTANALTENAKWTSNGYVQSAAPYLYQVQVTRTSPSRATIPFSGGLVVRERMA